jgi:hypothetical protein
METLPKPVRAIPLEPTSPTQGADDWPDPSSEILGTTEQPPAFPLEVLGHSWAYWISRAAESVAAPSDYLATALLVSAGSLIGNARRVSPWTGWEEPPVLWATLVGEPSSHKSPALDTVLSLIGDLEREGLEGYSESLRQYEADKVYAAQQRESWEAEVKKASEINVPSPMLPKSAIEPERPERYRVRVSDATTEALVRVAAKQEKGLLQVRDELAGWLGSFDRYTAGKGADRAYYLEAFGARMYVSDRVGNVGGPLVVPRNAISILGTIQPERLKSTLLRGVEDGLASRFFLVFPAQTRRQRPVRLVDQVAATNWLRRLRDLRLTPPSGADEESTPKTIRLSPDAANRFERWWQGNGTMEVIGKLAAWRGKGDGWVLRLALVLEYLWWSGKGQSDAEPEFVSVRAVQYAIDLFESYFWPMAIRCFGPSGFGSGYAAASSLASYLSTKGLKQVNLREIYKSRRVAGIRGAATAQQAAQILCAMHWLRPAPTREGPTRGRKTLDYDVNPGIAFLEPGAGQ